MALEVIGTVARSAGPTVAVDQNGIERPLQPGDQVYAGETIRTEGLNGVEIRLNDGRILDSGRASELELNNSEPAERSPTNADVESIQAAIAAGADPTDVAEPPAAVPLEDDGFSTVRIAYADPRGNVENGFDTTGIRVDLQEARNEGSGVPLAPGAVVARAAAASVPEAGSGPENEGSPSLRIDDVTVTEGADNTITFTVTRSGNLDQVSSVGYSVGREGDSAMAPSDFTAKSLTGILTFAAGEATKTITLNLVNDGGTPEPAEQFTVSLTDPANATIADGTGIGTILENPLDVSLQPDPDDIPGQGGIVTVVDLADPMHAYSKQFLIGFQGRDAQGKGIYLDLEQSLDPGFDVNASADYLVALEDAASPGTPFTGFTKFTVEGVTIYESSPGPLRLSDRTYHPADPSAITSVINPENGIQQTLTRSIDDDAGVSVLNDSGGGIIHYLNGLTGRDTLNGSDDSDVLNGGPGADRVFGNGGNDILVYESYDAVLDGGAGTDVLRIDTSANLKNNTSISNIEGLLITDDSNSDPATGSTVQLNALDVLHFTDTGNSLFIVGNEGDQVILDSAFAQQGGGPDPQGFVSYTAMVANTQVSVAIEQSIDVTIV